MFRVFLLSLFVVGARCQCTLPPFDAGCDPSSYDPANPGAVIFTQTNLLDAVTTAPTADNGLHDGFTHTSVLADGRTQTIEVHGFGECTPAFTIYRNYGTNPGGGLGWCKTAGFDCFMIGNSEVNHLSRYDPGRYYGRCIIDPSSGMLGTGADYEAKDYGIMSLKLGAPTTTAFSIKLQDVDAQMNTSEMGGVFGIGVNGDVIRPTSIDKGSAHAIKLVDILPAEGTEVGINFGGAPAKTVDMVAWVGDAALGYAFDKDVSNDDIAGHATFHFGNEPIVTLGFIYGFSWSKNDAPGTRDHPAAVGYTILQRPEDMPVIGCGVGCREVTTAAATIMQVIGDGSTGKCEPVVRTSSQYVYDDSSPPEASCVEKYSCGWHATSSVDASGEATCESTASKRLERV